VKTDFAKVANMGAWLRHPVLGDVSFDTFEKLGGTVHVPEPPREWAVNGSLFKDPVGGAWYLFGGLYSEGYRFGKDLPNMDFVIYKSCDKSVTWENLGKGFTPGFCFGGYGVPADNCPDVVMIYDPETRLYWLAYDWVANESSWETIHNPQNKGRDSGSALAYAPTPAGPFTRLPHPAVGNFALRGKLGRFPALMRRLC